MLRDAQGHEISGATAEAVEHLDRAIRAFTLVYGDAIGHYDAARQAAPALVMAHLGKAWPMALANDPKLNPTARSLLATAQTLPMNERERAHAAALAHAVDGHRAAAVTVLDRHLMHYPHDLVAHMAAMQMDGHLGRFHLARDRTARALASWSTQRPGWAIIRSFYGFGLEEAGDYAKAEDVARAAAELEPHGYWPHHCVSHVLEMTGRPQEGVAWMNERAAYWSAKDNLNRVHIWWHKALFHMELGDDASALALYDGPIMETVRPLSQSLCNPAALLWRLDTLGCNVGDRWKKQVALWEGRADGRLAVFPDIHAAMAELGAGDDAAFGRRLQTMRGTAAEDGEAGRIYRDIGVPTVQGLAAFRRGDYSSAVDHLLPARFDLWKMGGSAAQRDIIDWTLTEAATRAGLQEEALALAHERLAHRPTSVPNRRFLQRAQAIASSSPGA
jgi:tetratricopeptide (TPR) repeat protein